MPSGRPNNTGGYIAEVVQGNWLLFIDADSYPPLELISEVLSSIAADDHIGCGSTIDVEDGTLFNKLRLERASIPCLGCFDFENWCQLLA